jgi:hypothetical protein
MQLYWLKDRQTGEETLVDGDTVARVIGVEIGYMEWCIEVDEAFENGRWRVRSAKWDWPLADFGSVRRERQV